MSAQRKILHLDMDAFFASVEQAINPKLRGKPLIVGGRADRRKSVVCAASYEAKRLGIDSGMSCREAFRICPHAEFVAADSERYIYVSSQIAEMLQQYSPQIEQASVDEFYLDVTGMDKHFDSYLHLGLDIKNTIKRRFNITGSVGISVNRLMSKIASKLQKPDGMLILERHDISRVLGKLPVEKIPGIAGSLSRRLHDLSIFSFTDLEKADKELLMKRFGKTGLWMYEAVHPCESPQQPIGFYNQPPEPPKSVGHSHTLTDNIWKRDDLEAWLRLLCEMVGARLRRLRLEAAVLHIYLRRPDLEFIAKEKNFKEAVSDSELLFKRALWLLDSMKIPRIQIRALGVTASRLTPETGLFLLPSQEKRMRLLTAQDELNARFGDWTLYPARISGIGRE